MGRLDLLVTLNEEAMVKQMRAHGTAYDIANAVTAVPTAKIMGGGRKFSLHVNLDKNLENELRKAVSEFCFVEEYAELEPMVA